MGGVTRLEKVQETRFCLKALLTSLMCVSDVSAADVSPCSPVLVCLCACVSAWVDVLYVWLNLKSALMSRLIHNYLLLYYVLEEKKKERE